jgi:hypothetical protein
MNSVTATRGALGRWARTTLCRAAPCSNAIHFATLRSYCRSKGPHCGLQKDWPKGKTPSTDTRGLGKGAP